MKKLLFCFILSIVEGFSGLSSPVNAQTDFLQLYCPQINTPSLPGNNISSGEYFVCEPQGGNTFRIFKSQDRSHYEEFRYDSNFIYHVKETPWAGSGGAITCNCGSGCTNPSDSGKALFNKRYADRSLISPMPWLPRSMSVGQNYSQRGIVTGYILGENPERACSGINNLDLGSEVSLTYQGCIKFPGGSRTNDGYILTVLGGAGAGENFYFDRSRGWIGFSFGGGAFNFITDPIDTGPEPANCKNATGGGTGPVGINLPSTPCNAATSGDRSSVPVRCEACNQTGLQTGSCSQSFTISDQLKYKSCDQDPDPQCTDLCSPAEIADGKCHPLTKSWTGTVSINSANIQIPFVGNKGGESENKYLADYFDGTNEYYKNYNKYWIEDVSYAGVLRKLTPMNYQDTLKEQMIQRANESLAGTITDGKIHNYRITAPTRLCWDVSFVTDVAYALYIKSGLEDIFRYFGIFNPPKDAWLHYCLYQNTVEDFFEIQKMKVILEAYNKAIESNPILNNLAKIDIRYTDMGNFPGPTYGTKTLSEISNHLPPNPTDPDYETKFTAWKATPWGRLWEAVPMVSREDTKGQIVPYLGSKPLDTLEIDAANQQNQIENVPHVARLYESSKLVNQILLPYNEPINTTAQNTNSQTLLASTDTSTNTGQVLAAQDSSFHLELANTSYSGTNANITLHMVSDGDPGCDGDTHLYLNGGWFRIFGWGLGRQGRVFTITPDNSGSPVVIQKGESRTISWRAVIINTNAPSVCNRKESTLTCTFTVDGTGNLTNDCGGGTVPPPSCVQGDAQPVDKCVKSDAITDSNPNDKICCDKPIEAKVTAWEQFNNTNYGNCGGWYCQVNPDNPTYPTTDIPINNVSDCNSNNYPEPWYYNPHPIWKNGTSGGTEYTKDVSREVGISLYHPYLSEIYKATSGPTGVFNMFRPSTYPKFPDTPAYSKEEVNYTYRPQNSGGAQPTSGKFYFPYLGGIQQAKQWIVNTLIPVNN